MATVNHTGTSSIHAPNSHCSGDRRQNAVQILENQRLSLLIEKKTP